MKLKNLLIGFLSFAVVPLFASASTAVPKKIGPVSYYGALHTSGNKIIGAKNNQQAMLRGVSLYWSDWLGLPYYNPTVISWAVDNLKIDVFRYAMGIEYYDPDSGTMNKLEDQYSYRRSPEEQLSRIDRMVQAAIENDVYIIIDWHSYRADSETASAKEFFKTIASKYKDVPNVIYEIFHEPVLHSWETILNYANAVIPGIRENTENLVLVGTPNWSQHPEYAAKDPVPFTNIAYVLHFYAGSHSVSSYSNVIVQTLNAGYPVFISEWGTVNADGTGSPNSEEFQEWTNFMDQNMIPNCNWSLRQVKNPPYYGVESDQSVPSAIFDGNDTLNTVNKLNNAIYSASGTLVKDYLVANARSWVDSLLKGKNTGSCAFKQVIAKSTDESISGILKSGCTYTSSNKAVATVYNDKIVISDYGFAIFTGNDGTLSAVTVKQVPGQTIENLENITCNYSNACTTDTKTGRTDDYDGDGVNDYLITMKDTTNEGAKFTLTALDPTVVSVSKVECTSIKCSSLQKNRPLWMMHFHEYGTGRVVATAPAITDFRAMQDTFEITYEKGEQRISSRFNDQNVAIGATSTTGLPSETLIAKAPITYTYNGKATTPYLTKDGEGFIAGSQPAVVAVTATAPELENYLAFSKTVTFVIGDSLSAVNLEEYSLFINSSGSSSSVQESSSDSHESSSSALVMSSSSNEDTLESSSSEEGTTSVAPRVFLREELPARKGFRDLKGRRYDKQIPYRVVF